MVTASHGPGSPARSRVLALGGVVLLLPALALAGCGGGGDGTPGDRLSSLPGVTASRTATPPTRSLTPPTRSDSATRSFTASPGDTGTSGPAPEPTTSAGPDDQTSSAAALPGTTTAT
ncbi:MAG TPA: hypothetical protein VFT68_13430, partial [Lapillicoccus sp.]|nr:hypothetical protein [Lapillicoccus sp.]